MGFRAGKQAESQFSYEYVVHWLVGAIRMQAFFFNS